MYFIEAVKNFYAYLFEGRCRRHGRDLITVEVDGHCASTMPVCIECHPHYKSLAVVERPQAPDLIQQPLLAPELAEVEVG